MYEAIQFCGYGAYYPFSARFQAVVSLPTEWVVMQITQVGDYNKPSSVLCKQ